MAATTLAKTLLPCSSQSVGWSIWRLFTSASVKHQVWPLLIAITRITPTYQISNALQEAEPVMDTSDTEQKLKGMSIASVQILVRVLFGIIF